MMASEYPPFHQFILSSLSNHVEERPNDFAFLSAENEFESKTFKEIQAAIYSVAGYFQKSGCKKGEIVTITLPNTWYYIPCYMGAASAGMVTNETEYQLSNSQSKVVLTTANNLNKIIQASKNLPHLKIILYIGKLPSNIAETSLQIVNFDEIISKQYPFNPELIHFNVEEDLLALPYSSGTTGMPKGVMITHYNFMVQISILAMHHITKIDTVFPPDENAVAGYKIHFLPSYHAYGFAGLCINILRGSSTIIMKHFKPHLFLSLVEKYKVAQLNLVPMLLNYLSESPDVEKYDLSSIRFISSGGAPLSTFQIERVKKRFPSLKYVFQGYGMTELTTISHGAVFDEPMPNEAIGKCLPQIEDKIVNPETGKECNPGERGELWVKGPTVMKGYWMNEKATAETITPDGYVKTGDIASKDSNGFLFIHDRIKELIKVKAFQVPPAELEHLLLSHSKVSDVAVVGIPNSEFGEVPRAFVVPKQSNTISEQELINFVKEKVSKYKQLRGGVEFVSQIPRTASGKILRRKIKEDYLKKTKLSKL
uniref:Uncharacterized protein n=1 Tax=Panagrolaimus davidi TaxID=227884 RepID=A0A914Q9X2_9BILA